MGKASSAKKIARAARAGGRAAGVRQRNLLFPGAIGAILLLGVGMVTLSRSDHRDDAANIPPLVGDHWHSAIGVYVCDAFLPPEAEFESPVGIHTHADGVIHIHPFSSGGAGENATLGTFLEGSSIELTNDDLTVGDETWENGESKCGDETGELVVARWQDVEGTDSEPSLIYKDFDDLRFRGDGEGYTIAFVPEGSTDIPKPESAAQLTQLGAVDSDPTATTLPTETTLPVDPNAAVDPNATTTVPPEPTDTTVPGEG